MATSAVLLAAVALTLVFQGCEKTPRTAMLPLDQAGMSLGSIDQLQKAQVTDLGVRSAYVLAGEGWHPGVIGIVASRIVERHHRPTILVALEGDLGAGSGRSIPGFDLLAALHAGAGHLERYGGHRAAAGLTVRRDAVAAFRACVEAHAARHWQSGAVNS